MFVWHVSDFSHCWIKTAEKKQPKDWLRVGSQSIVLGKAWQPVLRAAGHSVPTGRKEREMNTGG